MLDSMSLYRYQVKYGVGKTTNKDEVSYESFLGDCRRAINSRTPREYHKWESDRQVRFTENLIVQYVRNSDKAVTGYVSEGVRDEVGLINALKIAILDCGILGEALADDTVQEIQINDCKSIWVVRGGKTMPYVDRNGKPYQFVSDDELQTTISRMCYSVDRPSKRMTTSDPLMNTRTSRHGFRVSGVNYSAITPDKAPFDFPTTSITIRKRNEVRLSFDDMIGYGTLTQDMVKFIKMLSMADTRIFFVGPTSSGKTTLLNEALWCLPPNLRVILIQNPTEILLYDRDINGVNKRNTLHWEAEDIPEGEVTATKPTMSNLIAHALRNTPDVIVPGESRIASEFYESYRAMLTGQRVMGTFHADDGKGAIERFASEVATATKGSKSEYLGSISKYIDCVICQTKLPDGKRRVMGIDIPTGNILSDGSPEVINLFTFVLSKKSKYDEEGNLVEIIGEFKQTGYIDENSKLANKLYKAGYSYEDIKQFCTDPNARGVTNEGEVA